MNISPPCSKQDEPVLQVWGGASLEGEVRISGAKNSALLMMAAALLSAKGCCLHNIPQLADVQSMAKILRSLGAQVDRQEDSLEITAQSLTQVAVSAELMQQLRASFFILGPLLARSGEAHIPLPGGCAIGSRPVNLHLQGLRALGAEITVEQGVVHARSRGRLQGATIELDYPSVGATATLIMAATLADGETVIANAAQEPEIVDLIKFCRVMGAKIRGAGTRMLGISGVSQLQAAEHCIIADRIEAGTFLVAGAITRSPLMLTAVNPRHLMVVIARLRAIGIQVVSDSLDRLRLIPGPRHQGITIQTGPYPGFPTDMQAQFMALLCLSNGKSSLIETVFESRLQHVAELNRLGAEIRVKGNRAVIEGVSRLTATAVTATDLRASAALVLAGLAADGITTIQGLHHLDRGYENLEKKLNQLGARLQRIPYPLRAGAEFVKVEMSHVESSAEPSQGSANPFLNAEVA